MKRIIIAIMLIFTATTVFAADTKIQALTDITSPAVGDDMLIIDDPDVTPLDRKINIGALLGVGTDLNTSGEVTGGDADTAVTSTLSAADTDTTAIATTSFVQQEINGAGGDDLTCAAGVCNVDSPVTSASAVTNATLTTALTVNTGTLTLTADAGNDSVLTIGGGAVGVSGSNTGDNTVATSGDAAVDFFGAGVDAVTDATTFTDIEGRSLSASGATLVADIELYSDTKCVIIETPTDADSFIFYHVELGAQVISAHCIVEDATSATIQFQQCDVAGDNCSEITSPLVCDVGGQADDGTIDLPDLDIDDWIRANVTATSGTPGHVTACINVNYDD